MRTHFRSMTSSRIGFVLASILMSLSPHAGALDSSLPASSFCERVVRAVAGVEGHVSACDATVSVLRLPQYSVYECERERRFRASSSTPPSRAASTPPLRSWLAERQSCRYHRRSRRRLFRRSERVLRTVIARRRRCPRPPPRAPPKDTQNNHHTATSERLGDRRATAEHPGREPRECHRRRRLGRPAQKGDLKTHEWCATTRAAV